MDQQQLAGLSAKEQRALLAKLLQKKTAKTRTAPLSFAQERLWFLYQLDPSNTANNPFNAIHLSGTLDAKVLQECFNQVVARHETLRTTFVEVAGNPVQVIASGLELSLPLIELEEMPDLERQARVERMAAEEAQRPFDLTHGPLVRPTLLRLNATEHILFWTVHHIISDGWSAGVLFQEMMIIYKARMEGSLVSPLPALPLQYADFAAWQRDWLQGEMLEDQRAYWQKQLENLSALELPTDHERPRVTSMRGATYTRMLSPKLTDELKSLSQQTGASLFMLLLAGFAALLERYSGQTDITLRTPVANRMRKELEGLIGYFVNTLALRANLSGEPTFRELIARVAEICRRAYENQDIPFEKILEDLHLAQRASGRQGPLFPVMFILQNAPLPLPDVPGLRLKSLELDGGLAPFELTMTLREVQGGIRCRLNYNTDLFERTSMERMTRHFEQVLQRAVANPDQGLGSLLECIPVEETPAVHLQAGRATEYVPPRTPLEKTLIEIWEKTLKIEQIGIDDNFFELGGDSLLSMHVINQARQAGLDLSPKQLFQHRTIAELAKVMDTTPVSPTEPDVITAEFVPLSPNQHWFFDQNFLEQHRFNVATLFETIPPLKLEPAQTKEVVRNLIIHHEALRMRFVQDGSEWRQVIVPPDDEVPFSAIDLSALPEQEQTQAIDKTISEIQGSLHLSEGPLLRVVLFDLGAGKPDQILMTIHHLVTDGFSGTILMQDFMTIYRQLVQGQPVQLPPRTTSFRQWNERLVEYARSPAIQQELELWQAKPGESLPSIPLPDRPNPSFIFESAYLISGTLDIKETHILLRDVLKAYNIQLIEMMLAVMAESIGQMKGDRSLFVDILRHGRDIPLDRVDLSRTVGWFVIHHPLFLKLDHANSLEEALPLVKEQYRRPLNGGAGYDLLRYMSGNNKLKKTLLPRPLLVFSHDSVPAAPVETFLRTVPKPIKNNTASQLSWPYLLELRTMLIEGKQLRWVWTSGETVYHRSTVEKLSENFSEILKKICTS